MSKYAWKFNGAFIGDDGLSSTFARAIETKDSLGQTVASGSPRYGRTSILCGAPNITTVTGTTSAAWNVLATGVSYDNATPVAVISNITAFKLQIHLNSISLDGSGDATYQYSMPLNASKGNLTDGLDESADESALEAWNPKGGVLCHGRADILCTVGYDDGGTWRRNRVGVMSCNLVNLGAAKSTWWEKTWLSPETPENGATDQTNMPTPWAMQNWASLGAAGAAPTECMICAADYQSTQKLGGVLYISAISRPDSTSGEWTADGFKQVLTFSRSASSAHCHGGVVVPDGAGGAKVLIARGDGHGNNAMYVSEVADISGYLNGSSDEGAGSFNSYAGGTGTGTPVIINGRIGGFTGTPPATDDTLESARRYGMQPIGLAQGGAGGDTIILGADEQHTAILMASSVPTSGGITLTPVFRNHRCHPVAGRTGGTSTSFNTSRLTFQIINRLSNNPTAELIANVTPQASAYQQDVTCLGVYSPNGIEWGVCWNTKVPEQAKPGFFGSSVIIGSPILGDNFGVRTTPIPSYLRGRPLLVDNSGKNHLADGALTLTKSSGMSSDAGSELNATEALPASYTPAPGFGTPIYFAADATAGSGTAKFVVRLCDSGSALPAVTAGTTSVLLVQFAIHPAKVADWRNSGVNGGVGTKDLPAPNSASHVGSNSCSQGFRFRVRLSDTVPTVVFSGYTENIYITENDGSPRIITIPVLASALGTFLANYVLELYVESTSVSMPIKGWLTPIGVYVADSSTEIDAAPCPVAATDGGTTIPATSLELSGFTLPTTGWTAYWSGKVPTDPMWDMWHAASHNHTSATRTSTTVTRITGANVGLDSVANAFAGHRLLGNLNGQTASFTDYGLAISSSAYVSTGTHDLTHASHGQASGSWTAIDIHAPTTMAASMPIFALCNTDSSRRIAVYADRVAGTLKVRYWDGAAWGSYATLTGFYFVPECPVHVALSYDGAGTLTIYASCGGSAISSTTLSVTPSAALTKMIAGDGNAVAPMEWWAGQVQEAPRDNETFILAKMRDVFSLGRSRRNRNTSGKVPL